MRFATPLALAAALLAPAYWAETAVAQQASAAAPAHNPRLHDWFEAKYEEQLKFSPLGLTQLGRKELYGELDDFSEAGAEKQLAWQKASVEEMQRTFNRATLSPQDQLAYDLWKYEYDSAAEAYRWRGNTYVLSQMQGIHTTLPSLLISTHRVDTAQDMRDYISRVGQFDRALGQVVDRAAANARQGVRPPYFAYDFVIAEAKKLIDGAPFTTGQDTALWQDGKGKIAALVTAGTIDEATAATARRRSGVRICRATRRSSPSWKATAPMPRPLRPGSARCPTARRFTKAACGSTPRPT
jgi:uncharacterized protein (DUF885 family)